MSSGPAPLAWLSFVVPFALAAALAGSGVVLVVFRAAAVNARVRRYARLRVVTRLARAREDATTLAGAMRTAPVLATRARNAVAKLTEARRTILTSGRHVRSFFAR